MQVLAHLRVRSKQGWLLAPGAKKGKELADAKLKQKAGKRFSTWNPRLLAQSENTGQPDCGEETRQSSQFRR